MHPCFLDLASMRAVEIAIYGIHSRAVTIMPAIGADRGEQLANTVARLRSKRKVLRCVYQL